MDPRELIRYAEGECQDWFMANVPADCLIQLQHYLLEPYALRIYGW